jgi:hypothetical protein
MHTRTKTTRLILCSLLVFAPNHTNPNRTEQQVYVVAKTALLEKQRQHHVPARSRVYRTSTHYTCPTVRALQHTHARTHPTPSSSPTPSHPPTLAPALAPSPTPALKPTNPRATNHARALHVRTVTRPSSAAVRVPFPCSRVSRAQR